MNRFYLLLVIVFAIMSCENNSSSSTKSSLKPPSLRIERVSDVLALLYWNKDETQQNIHFVIERKSASAAKFKPLAKLSSPTSFFADTTINLKKEKSYTYRIQSKIENTESSFVEKKLTLPKKAETPYQYLISFPDTYQSSNTQKFPLMVFLHGAGERGDDLEQVRKHGPPKQIAAGKEFPAIVLSPLCPQNIYWNTERLHKTLEKILEDHRIDKDRIYLTGLSMGGYGTWAWAMEHPNLFAAIAPICGGGNPEDIKKIANIPTWVFHGAKDSVVPIKESEKMVNALKAVGSNPRFTIYPDADHDSWTATFDDPDFYEWLFKQNK